MRDAAALLPLAESIADGSAIDWHVVEAHASAEDRATIRQLRVLDELATLHRTMPADPKTPPDRLTARRTAAAPAIGSWGRLDLIARIGGGKFGEVYRAWDRDLEREVAVKLLQPVLLADRPPSPIVTDGRLPARVRHPNVVTVYGVAVHEKRVGVWMELVDGETLEQHLIRQGPFSAREATLIGIDLCRALAAIHRAGLIHRDIKAQNVMREQGGRIVLMDFGTGRDIVWDAPHASADLAGTPLYLAPEILTGEPASPRTDLYSLGILLYHLVTGSFPARAATIDELKSAHARRECTRLRDARPDLPSAFVRVVDRATASDPEERYASAGALEADLMKSLEEDARLRTSPSMIVPRPPWWRSKTLALVATAAAVVMLAILLWRVARAPVASNGSQVVGVPGQISLVAVLPFENLSIDPDEAYLASAVPMELTARLGHISAVRVVPWTFMKRFDTGVEHSLKDVAQRTGAQAVVEGSVQRIPAAGGSSRGPVQVRVQVFQAATGTMLWSASFERDIANFFALQLEIAKEISARIHVVLATREQAQISRSRSVPPEAMEQYLKARYLMDVQTDVKGAVDLLQRAIQVAPAFAEAHAALASYYALESAYFGWVSSPIALRRAVDASNRAIEIDAGLAEAWGARGFARFALEWNWTDAETDFKHALDLDPTSVDALIGYSDYLSDRARHVEAIETSRKAEQRAPLSAIASRQVAYAFYMAHQYDDAIRQLRRTLEIEADYTPAHTLLGRAYLLTGKPDEAIAELQAGGPQYQHMLALAYAMAGRPTQAEELLTQMRSPTYGRSVSPYRLALVYAALGDVNRALDSLEAAYRERDASLTALAVDPMIDPIRSQPRVQALLTRLDLP